MIRPLLPILLFLQISTACQVPVFRYALERWEADPFRLQVLHRGPLDPALEKLLLATDAELAHKPAPMNVELEVLDVDKLSEVQQLSVVGLERVTQWPAILLHPPVSWGNVPPIVLEATESTLQQIYHSPARQLCLDGLLAGESAVWLLIESGDPAANEAAYETLERGLARAAAEITIPEGVILAKDFDKVGEAIDLEDVLRSSIPLKISFKIERLRRDDPAEQVFLKLLAGPTGELPDEPVIVPLFGRGRTPGPLPASSATEERILMASTYLCGACSCQVKSGNPGYDLLFRAAWHEHLQDGLVVIEKSLPPLPGIGQLSQPEGETTTPEPPTTTATTPPSGIPLWALIGGALALILIGGSIALTKKS